MQGGDDVDALGQVRALRRLGHAQVQKTHALKAQPLRQGLARGDQLGARFDAPEGATAQRFEIQIVEDETQVGLAGTVVGQRRALGLLGQAVQDLLDELHQVVNLFEFAP